MSSRARSCAPPPRVVTQDRDLDLESKPLPSASLGTPVLPPGFKKDMMGVRAFCLPEWGLSTCWLAGTTAKSGVFVLLIRSDFFSFRFRMGASVALAALAKADGGGERESIATFLFFPAFDFSSRALCLTFSFLCVQHDQIVRVVDDDDDDRSGGFLVRLSDRD